VIHAEPGALGHLEQTFAGAPAPSRLRFFGTHIFDLLDKLAHEGGGSEASKRLVICAGLNAAASSGAPVVRLWGSLKVTGTSEEVARAADLLELTIDENARRARPLRFVIALVNHQPGYGAPRPDRSLDDQDPTSPWNARRLYLGESFRLPGHGLLAERIEAFSARRALAEAPEILGWELVNELDTHRSVAGGALQGPEARALRDTFIIPALDLLAERFAQPILLGDLRGSERNYVTFARSILDALPARAKDRLVWTSHVYARRTTQEGGPESARSTHKLDLDLSIAAGAGLPFILGELGQLVQKVRPGARRFCRDDAHHDLARLFKDVLSPPNPPPFRTAIEAVLFWGEGRCNLVVPGAHPPRSLTLGAGGDSADLGPHEDAAWAALAAARRLPRFRADAVSR
jgi:hypothetical protein